MNKAELISAIAERTSATKKDTEVFVNAFVETVMETLKNGDSVQLVGFGTFETRKRAARTGRNPQTGEDIHIPATVTPTFSAGSRFKEIVKTNN